MPSTENRLSTLEDGTRSPLPPASREHIAMMVDAGIPRARAEEIDKAWPDVTILTDAELDLLIGDDPTVTVGGRTIPFSEITDEELDRLIAGVPPAEVLARLL
jgi:hypothetical protein